MTGSGRNRFTSPWTKLLISFTLSLIFLVSTGCNQFTPRDELETIKNRGTLRVLIRNNATCYYEGPNGFAGFEYDLVRGFANYLGVKVKCVVTDSFNEMIPALLQGKADLIAAGFTVTENRMRRVAFGPPYMEVQQEVVGRRGGPSPSDIGDLIGQPLWVNAGTSYEERLKELKTQYPGLSWLPVSGYETEELLEMVWRGIIPLTIADSNIVAVNRRYYPQLKIRFAIQEGEHLAWAVHPQHNHLLDAIDHWFAQPSTSILLDKLKQHYYGHLKVFDYVDLVKYHRRLRHRLPRYENYFKAAAKKHGLDWKLVAAQSYQESHWDPQAVSFTGVRGIMMLTQETASSLGVESRLDPRQSIDGGARYLALLHERIGNSIPEPDRTYMALAAYNVGWGHLEDARALAKRLDKDPDNWQDVSSTLPLLRQKKYYRSLPHGYARGTEPVRYVNRIKTYYRILLQATGETPKEPSELAEIAKLPQVVSLVASR
ncbi:MAG: membrane-bound lytic murein transglycosylase MltF [Deltaproteobacteria bacterium]|nr:membrane-bound lytic murein transglycosylase MltF [Deltaproteobacteria bacterium]